MKQPATQEAPADDAKELADAKPKEDVKPEVDKPDGEEQKRRSRFPLSMCRWARLIRRATTGCW